MLKLSGFPSVDIRGPRAPLGPLPNVLSFVRDPIAKLPKLAREYGNIVALADRNPAMVLALGAELNREVLTNTEVFLHSSELPFPAPEGSALRKFTSVLLFANGEANARQRRLMMPAFHKSSLSTYAGDIVALTDAALRRWPVGETGELTKLVRDVTLEIALRCIFGIEPSPEADALAGAMHIMQELSLSPLVSLLPVRLPGFPYNRLYQTGEQMERDLRALVERKRRRSREGRDALSLMIEAHDEDGTRLSDLELIGGLHVLFSASYDTSTITIACVLLLLALHPDALDQVVAEIDAVLGDQPPSLDKLGELEVLDRSIKESARLLPVTPFMFFRELARETKLGSHTLPRGANVVLSPYLTHRDPELYPQPDRFLPERWSTIRPTPYQYLPFGAGPRTCLGAAFASMSVRLVLAMILQRHQPSVAPRANISRKMRGIIFDFAHGIPMRFVSRDAPRPRHERPRGDIHEIIAIS